MNTKETSELRKIRHAHNILGYALERLESPEGCVAATCCDDREAGKEQGSAERAKPSGAAHVAPVQVAEDILETLIKHTKERASDARWWHRFYKKKWGYKLETAELKGERKAYKKTLEHLKIFLSVCRRKANAAEPLEHE